MQSCWAQFFHNDQILLETSPSIRNIAYYTVACTALCCFNSQAGSTRVWLHILRVLYFDLYSTLSGATKSFATRSARVFSNDTYKRDEVNNNALLARGHPEAREFRTTRDNGKSPRALCTGQGIHAARKQERKRNMVGEQETRQRFSSRGGTNRRGTQRRARFSVRVSGGRGSTRAAEHATTRRRPLRRQSKHCRMQRRQCLLRRVPAATHCDTRRPRFHRGNKETAATETKSRNS